jgi:TonB family protein
LFRLPIFLCVVLLFRPVVFAQDAGVLTKAPALISQVEAIFPPEMLDAGIPGDVGLNVVIDATGRVSDVVVSRSAGAFFDEAALLAVKQYVFSPAEVDGVATAVQIALTYTFSLKAEVISAPVDAGVGATFSGRIVERGTRTPMALAQILVGDEAPLEVFTNEDGTFSVSNVTPGLTRVRVLSPDYNTYDVSENFIDGSETKVTYFVRRKVYGAYETVVRAQKERKEVAVVTLKQEEIRLIPGTNGDAFRVVQNLPGVARAPFGIGLLIVRGGKAYDTKTYVDEVQVPQLFHFGGLYSTYNARLLDSLSFQAGNFGAEFGRSIGGLVTATSRTPSQNGWHGYADINLVDASAQIEAPINKDWSFSLSGRRSYIDSVLPAVLKLIPGAEDTVSFSLAPRYWDYQAKIEHRPNMGKNRFFVSIFGSSDSLAILLPNPSLDPEGRGEFGTSLLYNRLLVGIDRRLDKNLDFRSRNSIGFDNNQFNLGKDIFARTIQVPIRSRNTFIFSFDEYKTQLTMGIDLGILPYQFEVQSPPLLKLNQIPDPFSSRRLQVEKAWFMMIEPALFADVTMTPVENLKVVAGFRADYNSQMAKSWADPRLSLFWQLHERVLVKGGFGIYHQPPDYRQGDLSPTFGNPNLLPEGARQFMLGSEVKFTDAISLDVQFYFKDLFDQTRSTLGSVSGDVSMASVDTRYTNNGKGRAFGAEILLRHALTKNFFGWISYSLSRTERDFFGGTVYGQSALDQPHNLVVVASYKLPFDFIVGAKIRYTSGPLNRPVTGTIYDVNANYFLPIQDTQYSRRLPDFFQLDVRIDKKFVFENFMLALYLDVQNATNRQNVEAVTYSYDYSQEAYFTGLPILPVLGIRGEF